MSANALTTEVRTLLAPLANAEKAAGMAAYMKHRFVFLGVQTPARRQATRGLLRGYAGALLAAARALWREDEREFQYVACDLLARHDARLDAADLDGLLDLATRKSWWDTVDALAGIVGDLVHRERRLVARMDALIDDDNFWLRRVALLHQLGWKGETDTARLFDYCRRRADEPEFFIRKAIGWALRDYAWHNPEAVRTFLAAEGKCLSPLSRREAAKNLD